MAGAITAEDLYGTWELEKFERTNADGSIAAPYTERPLGRIMYTRDGRMAAFMMHPEWADKAIERGSASYSGDFWVENDQVHHKVDFASSPALLGSDLVRDITLGEDRVILGCPAIGIPGAREALVWLRSKGTDEA